MIFFFFLQDYYQTNIQKKERKKEVLCSIFKFDYYIRVRSNNELLSLFLFCFIVSLDKFLVQFEIYVSLIKTTTTFVFVFVRCGKLPSLTLNGTLIFGS